MTESCPIAHEAVEERSTRIGAGLTLLVVAASLWYGRFWIPLALAADFALRSRGRVAFSPIAQVAKGLRKALRIRPVPVNAGPKRFAALVGAAFSLVIALGLRFNQPWVVLAAAAVLVPCAALEAFLGFCVGCKVYSLLPRPRQGRSTPPLEHP